MGNQYCVMDDTGVQEQGYNDMCTESGIRAQGSITWVTASL